MACGNPGHREVAAVQRYKFQGLLTVDPPPQDGNHVIVTISLFCNDPSSYFKAGADFARWQGRDVGHGVVTRRLFV
jgi:hypothetical protein